MKVKINKELQDIYNAKYKEYNKYSLDELKALYEESKKSKKTRIGGTYKKAFIDVVSNKLQQESIRNTIEENKPITEGNLKES